MPDVSLKLVLTTMRQIVEGQTEIRHDLKEMRQAIVASRREILSFDEGQLHHGDRLDHLTNRIDAIERKLAGEV